MFVRVAFIFLQKLRPQLNREGSVVESGHFVGGWGLAHAELCYVKIKTFSPIEGEGQAMLIFLP